MSPHPPAFELVPLRPAHAEAAASLVAGRYRRLRARVPVLPGAWAAEAPLAGIARELAVRGSGVAAVRDGTLLGFQAATLIDGHGGRWSYTPDVGHATAVLEPRDARQMVQAMYASLAGTWAREACLEHVVTVLADDADTVAALVRLGFGETVIDLVRDLSPIEDCAPVAGVAVRRAGPPDAAAILELHRGLRRHLAGSPIFLRTGPAMSLELHRRLLADPGVATFIAEADGEAISFLRIGPSATDVATIVRDPGTASVTSAFTLADRRGDGVATCLLDAAIGWARDGGYARTAVDHESANGEAARFWARHFVPVAISLGRRLPPRAAP